MNTSPKVAAGAVPLARPLPENCFPAVGQLTGTMLVHGLDEAGVLQIVATVGAPGATTSPETRAAATALATSSALYRALSEVCAAYGDWRMAENADRQAAERRLVEAMRAAGPVLRRYEGRS